MHAIPRRFIFGPQSPLLLNPILASVRKARECVCQKHPRRSAVWDGPVGSKQRGVAVRIGASPPTIWLSCRPVRRKNQDGAYRGAARNPGRRFAAVLCPLRHPHLRKSRPR